MTLRRLHGVWRLTGAVVLAGLLLGGCGQYVYNWDPAEGWAANEEFRVWVDGEHAERVYLTFPVDSMKGVVVRLDEVTIQASGGRQYRPFEWGSSKRLEVGMSSSNGKSYAALRFHPISRPSDGWITVCIPLERGGKVEVVQRRFQFTSYRRWICRDTGGGQGHVPPEGTSTPDSLRSTDVAAK